MFRRIKLELTTFSLIVEIGGIVLIIFGFENGQFVADLSPMISQEGFSVHWRIN